MTIEDAYKQAVEYFNSERYAEAEHLCNSILQSVPNHISSINILGVITQLTNRHDIAIEHFKQAIEIDGNPAFLYHNLAISLIHLERYEEAINLLKQALLKESENGRFLLDMGFALEKTKQYSAAIDCYQQAIKALPTYAEAHNNLGNTLVKQGKYDAAVASFQQATTINPDYAEAFNNLGLANEKLGMFDESILNYNRAISCAPDFPQVHFNLGNLLKDLKRYKEAINCYNQAISLNPDYTDAHINLGNLYVNLDKTDRAIASYNRALLIMPDNAEALNNLGYALTKQCAFTEAISCFEKAVVVKPDFSEAYNNFGHALNGHGDHEGAVACFYKAIAINPDYAEAYSNLGNLFFSQGDNDAAIAKHHKAISIKPNLAEAYYNLGKIQVSQDKLDEAAANYRKTIAIDPSHINANWNLSLILLVQGDLEQGWQQYEWRLKSEHKKNLPIKPVKMWTGEPLQGKNIIVFSEQGIGDEIIFSGCIPDLLALCPEKLFLECDPRLEPLFERSFSNSIVKGRPSDTDISWVGEDVTLDYSIPIGGLPKFFRNKLEDFPKRDALLLPNPKLVAKWNQRLDAIGDGLKVGISWRGGKYKDPEKNKSIPLEMWASLLSRNAKFINLQYGDTVDEVKQVCNSFNIHIHDWDDNDPLKNMDNLAALIATLDLIISVDNTTVHLAGTLGTPTWVMITNNQSWPWNNLFVDSTPFYKNVKLFRRDMKSSWEGVLKHVTTSLQTLIDAET
ncbi:MAG: tetratricopeptide repeat protein [Magnetococcales bacterium]|nr:tetratricopeptide repeat protein [Magnetococcales bacterium]